MLTGDTSVASVLCIIRRHTTPPLPTIVAASLQQWTVRDTLSNGLVALRPRREEGPCEGLDGLVSNMGARHKE